MPFEDFEDFKLDPVTGGLVLDASGNVESVSGAERVRQQLEARLDIQRRSWYRDQDVGVDYLGRVTTKPFLEDEARAEFVRESLACPGVTRVDSVVFTLDLTSRSLTVRVDATTDEQESITAEVGA
jgi:hypothetical protein